MAAWRARHSLGWRALSSPGTVAFSGCGGSEPTTFNDEVEHNFVSSCVDSATHAPAPAAESDAERICGCMYDELKARMSFDEFKAADDSLRQGEQMSADPRRHPAGCRNRLRLAAGGGLSPGRALPSEAGQIIAQLLDRTGVGGARAGAAART